MTTLRSLGLAMFVYYWIYYDFYLACLMSSIIELIQLVLAIVTRHQAHPSKRLGQCLSIAFGFCVWAMFR